MNHSGSYRRFGLMIATSAIFMFGLMYLNTYALPHVHWSETRFFMTLIMAAAMAVVTSERAGIEDVRVRKLADKILQAQKKEIAEMEWLLDDISRNGKATTPEEAAARPVPEFSAD